MKLFIVLALFCTIVSCSKLLESRRDRNYANDCGADDFLLDLQCGLYCRFRAMDSFLGGTCDGSWGIEPNDYQSGAGCKCFNGTQKEPISYSVNHVTLNAIYDLYAVVSLYTIYPYNQCDDPWNRANVLCGKFCILFYNYEAGRCRQGDLSKNTKYMEQKVTCECFDGRNIGYTVNARMELLDKYDDKTLAEKDPKWRPWWP